MASFRATFLTCSVMVYHTILTLAAPADTVTATSTCVPSRTLASDNAVYTVQCNIDYRGDGPNSVIVFGQDGVASIGDCINLCESTTGCVAVDWYGADRGGYGPAKRCWGLSSTQYGTQNSPGEIVASKLTCTPSQTTASHGAVYTVNCDIDYLGDTNGSILLTQDGVASIGDCINICESTAGCVAVDWYGVDRGVNGPANRCYVLARTIHGTQKMPGEIAASRLSPQAPANTV